MARRRECTGNCQDLHCKHQTKRPRPSSCPHHQIQLERVDGYPRFHSQEGGIQADFLHPFLGYPQRMSLLARHGGLRLDATMFVANPISETIFSKPYWTIHREVANSITRGRWTGYCQAGQPNAFIHSFCRDFFYAYWTKYDKLVDYFLIDYVMDIGYRNLPHMQQLIDSVSPSNQRVLDLDRSFHLVYEQEAYRELVCSQTFFKLN